MPTTTNPKDYAQQLKEFARKIAGKDKKLEEELNDKRNSAALKEEAEGIKEVLLKNTGDEESFETVDDDAALEAVIVRVGRPVLFIRNSEIDTAIEFEDAESEVWRDRLLQAKEPLKLTIPSVGRIELKNHPSLDWCGTGWLVDNNTIVTNRHVAELFGRKKGSEYIFRQGIDGAPMSSNIDMLEEESNESERLLKLVKILHIEPEPGPDIAFIKVEPVTGDMPVPVVLDLQTMEPDSTVAVIGYPAKDSRMPDLELMEKIFGKVYNKKRLAPGQITDVSDTKIFHDCSTLGGNSGSAIISLDSGKAVGLHFAGRFMKTNYAVPAKIIAQRLDAVKNGRTLIPINIDETTTDNNMKPNNNPQQPGTFSFNIPLQVTVSVRVGNGAPIDINIPQPVPKPVEEEDEFITEGRPEEFADRKGYQDDFLGEEFPVPLPEVTAEKRKKDILTYDNNGEEDNVLRYQHFSVMMSKSRRQCIFSAVNINGAKSKKATRVGWRTDPRIPADAQIMHECYGSAPKYSRGHMTRREDPVWGTANEALQGNSDSMCVTNTTPQMQSFNAPVWLALEDYALKHAREDKMLISVFTGPVFKTNDIVQYGVKIPKDFWKIIVFIHDETGELTATGYMMSQEEHIPDEEFVFGEFGTAQVAIATIEKKTGLSFGDLRNADPMNEEAPGDPVRALSSLEQVKF